MTNDVLHVYTETGQQPIDDVMDYGLGLHDALALSVRGGVQTALHACRDAVRAADIQIVGELLRRLEMVRRLIESYDREIRVGVQYRFSAAEHLCGVAERALARYTEPLTGGAAASGNAGQPGSHQDGSAAAPASLPSESTPFSSPGVSEPGDDGPALPPSTGEEPPAVPPRRPGGWYRIGQCNRRTGLRITYCRYLASDEPVDPPDEILAGPFPSLEDCESWVVPDSWCQPAQPPPGEPEPPSGPRCVWPSTGQTIMGAVSCCKVIGGAPPPWIDCGPGTAQCQPWVICGPGDGSWALGWTTYTPPPTIPEPPGPGWVRVPIELPRDEYMQWWEQWMTDCGIPYDPAVVLPPNSCYSAPPMEPPPPRPPEPPADDPPVHRPPGPVEVCPVEPRYVGLA